VDALRRTNPAGFAVLRDAVSCQRSIFHEQVEHLHRVARGHADAVAECREAAAAASQRRNVRVTGRVRDLRPRQEREGPRAAQHGSSEHAAERRRVAGGSPGAVVVAGAAGVGREVRDTERKGRRRKWYEEKDPEPPYDTPADAECEIDPDLLARFDLPPRLRLLPDGTLVPAQPERGDS